jgi:hypothetical protein
LIPSTNFKQTLIRAKACLPKWVSSTSATPLLGEKSIAKDKAISCTVINNNTLTGDYFDCSGAHSNSIISYGIRKKNTAILDRYVIFPLLRLIPDSPTSHFSHHFKDSIMMFLEDSRIVNEAPVEIKTKGTLTIINDFMNGGAKIIRTFSPSPNYPALIEKIEVINKSKDITMFSADEKKRIGKVLKSSKIADAPLFVSSRLVDSNGDFRSDKKVSVKKKLVPGASAICYVVYFATKKDSQINFNTERELRERLKTTEQTFKTVQLVTNNLAIDTLFSHSLLHGIENIYNTSNGLLHFSGGGVNYGGILAIEQAGYTNPIFPLIDFQFHVKQAINCYRFFGEKLLDHGALPDIIYGEQLSPASLSRECSLEIFASGLARFLLAQGSSETAKDFMQVLNKSAELIKLSIASGSESNATRRIASIYAYDALIHINYLQSALNSSNESEAFAENEHLLKILNELKQAHSNLSVNPNSLEDIWSAFYTNSNADIVFNKLVEYSNRILLKSHSIYPESNASNKQTGSSSDAMFFVRIIIKGLFGLDPISFKVLRFNPKVKARMLGLKYNDILFEIDNTDELKIKISGKTYPSNGGTDFNFDTLTWK